MSKLFVNIGLSLDGYMAPEGMTMENWDKPEYKNWGAKWGAMMAWIVNQQYFRENLKLGPGGETGPVNDLLRSTTERIGANIMGKRMFDQGEIAWPEEAPFHTPVYVLTHEKREPWVRPGGTTFYFINDGPERALELARESAGSRDIRIAWSGCDPAVPEPGCRRRAGSRLGTRVVRRRAASLREPTRARAAVSH